MTAAAERVVLIVEANQEGGPDSLSIRLRHILKRLARDHHVRVIWHQDCPADWVFGKMLQAADLADVETALG